jgi:hypothetical protein
MAAICPSKPLTIARVGAASLALAALAWLPGGPDFLGEAPARAAPARAQMGGTWDLTWQNSRGVTRKGRLLVEQRGAQITARMPERDNATASGSIDGRDFSLRGSRLGLPITITGRVEGRRMSGALTALGIERRFTGTKRRR